MLLKSHKEEEVTIAYRAFMAQREISWKGFCVAFLQVTSTIVYPIKYIPVQIKHPEHFKRLKLR